MQTIQFIAYFRHLLLDLKNKGQKEILIDNLDAYLSENQKIIESNINNSETEQKRIEREMSISQKRFENDIELRKLRLSSDIEMFKSVIEAGLNALKSSIIINGGAAGALLAFIGGIIRTSSDASISVTNIGFALLVFMIGAGLAGSAMATRYLSQFFYSEAEEKTLEKKRKCVSFYVGCIIHLITVMAGIASYIAFFYGAFLAYSALIIIK